MRTDRSPAVVLALLLVFAACGGGGAGGGDRASLDSLQSSAELYAGTSERTITGALELAARNAGTPLGDEAYTFAEAQAKDLASRGYTYTFGQNVPPVPDEVQSKDSSGDQFATLLGFVGVVPAAYHDRAVAVVQAELAVKAADLLRQLDESIAGRRQWAAELQHSGSTTASWDSGSYEWLAPVVSYVRSAADRAELTSPQVAGWDALVNAVTLAQWAPSKTDIDVSGNVITSSYTPAQVEEAVAHIDELEAAVTAARAQLGPAAARE